MLNNADLSYLLTLQNLTTEQLLYRRTQLLQLRKKLQENYTSISSDASAIASRRIDTIEIALMMLTSKQDLVVQDPLPAALRVLKGGEQFAVDYPHAIPARVIVTSPATLHDPSPANSSILKGWAQHAEEYPVDFETRTQPAREAALEH